MDSQAVLTMYDEFQNTHSWRSSAAMRLDNEKLANERARNSTFLAGRTVIGQCLLTIVPVNHVTISVISYRPNKPPGKLHALQNILCPANIPLGLNRDTEELIIQIGKVSASVFLRSCLHGNTAPCWIHHMRSK